MDEYDKSMEGKKAALIQQYVAQFKKNKALG